jgi:hypothetical protein
VHLQFPCTGNLIVVSWIGVQNHDIVAITDGNGNNYTSTGPPFGLNQSGDSQIYYAAAANTGTTMVGPVLSTIGTDISGSTAILFDISGADTLPFDSAAGLVTASGVQSTTGPIPSVTITPSTPNGLVISSIGVTSNTVNGVSPGNFLSAVPVPILSPNHTDQNNGWALNYNSTASPETFVWATQDGPVDSWASIAAAFQSASVLPTPDFTLAISPASQTIGTTDQANYTLTLQSVNGFNSTVQLTCTGLPANASCSLNGASVAAGALPLTIQSQNAAVGTYNFVVSGNSLASTHAAQAQLIVSSGSFSGSISPQASTINVGTSQSFTVQIDSRNGFQGPVALSCLNPPSGIMCSFSPTPVTVSSNMSTTSSLTVNVSAKPTAALLSPPLSLEHIVPMALLQRAVEFLAILLGILLCWAHRSARRHPRLRHSQVVALLLFLLSGVASCGGNAGTSGTPNTGNPVTIQLAVQGTSGNTTVTLTSVAITIP